METKQRKYFDFMAYVGKKSVPDSDFPSEENTLLNDMAYAKVHGAAIIHNACNSYSYEYANTESRLLAKNNKRLFPLAMVTTTADVETKNPDYYKDLLKNGVCGFILNDKNFLGAEYIEKLARALVKYKRPLILENVTSQEKYKMAAEIAKTYPKLNIILTGTHWSSNRMFWDAMKKHKNLYFEISSNHTYNILELAKKHLGIERALFSSAWPLKSMGAIKSMIEYADIPDADKDMVAYKNACRLFGISPCELELYDEKDNRLDEIAKEADLGKPISAEVIDAHAHMTKKGQALSHFMIVDGDFKEMAKKMSRLGVDRAIVAPWSGIYYSGTDGNRASLEALKNYPDKYLAYSCLNANFPEETDETLKFHQAYPEFFVGIKPYPASLKFDLENEECQNWFGYANEHHLAALIHTGTVALSDQIVPLIEKYPNVTFILAHSGASFSVARHNAKIAKKFENVVLEITYTSTLRGMIEFLVSEVGAERVIYGSDMPMREPASQLGWVCYADISPEDKRKILADNIKRILDKRILSIK